MHIIRFTYLVVLFSILLLGCSAQKKRVILNPKKSPIGLKLDDNATKHNPFLSELKEKCEVNNTMSILAEKNHVRIDFNSQEDFKLQSFKLTSDAENKLKCIAPIIRKDVTKTVQIIGHANESISMAQNRYLSNHRAISAAELLYKEGLDSIYAKGCPESKESDEDYMFADRSITVYIYPSELDIKNPCK